MLRKSTPVLLLKDLSSSRLQLNWASKDKKDALIYTAYSTQLVFRVYLLSHELLVFVFLMWIGCRNWLVVVTDWIRLVFQGFVRLHIHTKLSITTVSGKLIFQKTRKNLIQFKKYLMEKYACFEICPLFLCKCWSKTYRI